MTYVEHGNECRACGRVADKFVAECGIGDKALLRWYFNPLDNPVPVAHLNLYGTDSTSGKTFMMTSDHVVPWSLGGSDGIDNRVPLCARCNWLKGNDVDWLTDLPRNIQGYLVHRKDRQVVGKQKRRVNWHG